ncbi:MAG: hypothetical protein CVV44_10840 [Spirochaetae bacterium HGW-Spirochaetae-1]|jgi:hypothetical protein|nr:MAG: hypothetical protein CVV44_10840 [Spirochaetae bacterium HGW-Spirochaetae-1]
MKKILVSLVLCLAVSSIAFAEVQKDGFDVTILYSATKSFNISDARIAAFRKYLEGNLDQNSSGSWSSNDMFNEEFVYLDKKGNTVKVETEKNTKTGVGTATITIIGPDDFVTLTRAVLK